MSQVVFDLEADNLLQEATQAWCISYQDMGAEEIFSSEDVATKIDDLNTFDEIIGHNILGYDMPLAEKLYGWKPNENITLTDTLVLSRLSNPDRRKPPGYTGKGGPHSLDCWGYRVCRAKPGHEDWSVFSPAMLQRNREDVAINKLVYHLISSEMDGYDWSESIDLEHKVLRIITQQEINGVKFDTTRAQQLVDELEQRVSVIDHELIPLLPINYTPHGVSVNRPFLKTGAYSKMVLDWYGDSLTDHSFSVGGPFTRLDSVKLDIGSIHQVKSYFLKMGWVPTEYNYSKKTGQPTSPKLTEDSYDTITGGMGPQIKDRMLFSHRRGQIQGWLDRVRPDGRLSASANTCGTPTGRFRHSNVVNVPKAADYVPYGKEMRSLFCVPPGYKLVGCDAEQLELRILAHFMGDQLYIQEILHGDIHTHNQSLAGLPNRDAAKTFIYAFIYGAGDAKLGSIVGGDEIDGAELRKQFLNGLPDLERLIKRVKRGATKGYLKGLDGRKLWLRRGESGEVMKHKALNLYIQGAGAIIMKKAITIQDFLIRQDNLDAKKVLDMHDEGQYEALEKDAVRCGELMAEGIVQAGIHFNTICPMAAQYAVGNNWSETH